MMILIWLCAISATILVVGFSLQLRALRTGKIMVLETDRSGQVFTFWQKKIDWLAVFLVLAVREGVRYLIIKLLFGLKKMGSYLRIAGAQLEKKFAHTIDLVHGRGTVGKKGAVSFFLREIGETKIVAPKQKTLRK